MQLAYFSAHVGLLRDVLVSKTPGAYSGDVMQGNAWSNNWPSSFSPASNNSGTVPAHPDSGANGNVFPLPFFVLAAHFL